MTILQRQASLIMRIKLSSDCNVNSVEHTCVFSVCIIVYFHNFLAIPAFLDCECCFNSATKPVTKI